MPVVDFNNMPRISYHSLALGWQPAAASSRNFHRIAAVVVGCALLIMLLLSRINVPEQAKRERAQVPDRIAEFIARKEKPVLEIPQPIIKPLPKPVEKQPEPQPEVKPEVIEQQPANDRVRARSNEPLTESQKSARKVAEKSGLLALANELNDLTDTTDVQAKLSKKLTANNTAANQTGIAPSLDGDALTAGIAQTGGRVDQADYAGKVANTELENRNIEKIALNEIEKPTRVGAASKARTATAGEDVSLVFDKNKGALYSLYERERRSTPNLEGKIVFQLMISPNGDVLDVKIISSELDNPELEARLLSRIKSFKFKAGGDKPTTITYPVEFLPN